MLANSNYRSSKIVLPPIDIKYHIFKGVKTALKIMSHFDKSKKVLVYFDPDIDGLISGYFVCRFLVDHGYQFSWYINENRQHGFKIDVSKLKGTDIIAVDFRIEYDELISIVESGSNIVSLDHHENGNTLLRYKGSNGKAGVIINNQYGFEEDDGRYLSGAGVVFEVLRLFDPSFDNVTNRALVGLTLLSDIRDIENRNARGYLTDLYEHKYKGYIKYLIEGTIGDKDYSFGVPRLDRNFVDYTFSPIINATLRYNKGSEAVNFILGSGYINKQHRVNQQKFTEKLTGLAKCKTYDNIRSVEIDCKYLDDEENALVSNFIGLVTSQFLTDRSSIGYLKLIDGDIGRASFRGKVNGLDYLDEFLKKKLLVGVGHPSAFGILDLNVSDSNFEKISDSCNRVESGKKNTTSIMYVRNLSVFVAQEAKSVAVENIFCLSQNRTYLKYMGDNIIKKRGSDKYTEYSIDGISVLCFDNNVTVKNGLILPICERGVVYFYLESKDIDMSE